MRVWHFKNARGEREEEQLTTEQGAADDNVLRDFAMLEGMVSRGLDPNVDAVRDVRARVAAAIALLPKERAKHHVAECDRIAVKLPTQSKAAKEEKSKEASVADAPPAVAAKGEK